MLRAPSRRQTRPTTPPSSPRQTRPTTPTTRSSWACGKGAGRGGWCSWWRSWRQDAAGPEAGAGWVAGSGWGAGWGAGAGAGPLTQMASCAWQVPHRHCPARLAGNVQGWRVGLRPVAAGCCCWTAGLIHVQTELKGHTFKAAVELTCARPQAQAWGCDAIAATDCKVGPPHRLLHKCCTARCRVPGLVSARTLPVRRQRSGAASAAFGGPAAAQVQRTYHQQPPAPLLCQVPSGPWVAQLPARDGRAVCSPR